MLNNYFKYFITNNFSLTIFIIVMLILILSFILIIYSSFLKKNIFPKFSYKKFSDYLPFKTLYSDNSLMLSNNSLIKVYKLSGIQTGMQIEDVKKQFLDLRTRFFNQINDSNVILRFFTIRNTSKDEDLYEFDNIVSQKIYDKWQTQGLKIFTNNFYIVISVYGSKNREKLNQYCNYIESMLSIYKPKLLTFDSSENIASFFARILSPVTKPKPIIKYQNLSSITTVDNISFLKNGIIKFSSGNNDLFASNISFKVSPDFLDEEFFNSISTIKSEMIIMNSFKFLSNSDIDNIIKQKRTTIEKNEDIAEEQIKDIEISIDENVSENQSLIDYYPLFLVFGTSLEDLNNNVEEFKKICASFGVSPIVERFASKVSWFSLIPGFDIFPRSFKMLSKTAVISVPMSNSPEGIKNCDWGEKPLVIFPTAQGTPYQFQFHVSDKPVAVAHTLTIGPTGGGKTTLFSFLISQSLRHQKLKAFFFDRNKGAEIFTLSIGGKYITMSDKEKGNNFQTHLNPLKMKDSSINRVFLRKWLSIISEQNDPKSLDEISRCVAINYDYIEDKDKKLSNLYESCFSLKGNMRGALKKWVDPLQYGKIFNEDFDTLDLDSRLTTFDFTTVLNDEILAPAVVSYILHRINTTTVSGGNPSLIMIDETAPMLENKMFRDNFIAGLQEGRKNRQAYMVSFQRANILDKLGIGDVVRGQAQTVLFFRNPAADLSDYKYWNLNPLEMAFIQGKAYPNLKRAVLLSRPVNNESVILNTELGGLGNLLRLFESGRSSVILAEELYKSFGSNFIEEYLKKTSYE